MRKRRIVWRVTLSVMESVAFIGMALGLLFAYPWVSLGLWCRNLSESDTKAPRFVHVKGGRRIQWPEPSRN